MNIMNRNIFLSLLLALFATGATRADNLKVEPAFWWSGMKETELQLMVYGENIGSFRPSVQYPGVRINSSVALESPNYLIVYLDVAEARPGKFDITFSSGKENRSYSYELKERKPHADQIEGFDASDVLYLIMPDRFANGNPANDQIPMRQEYKVDRTDPNARHGGDLAGIKQHLDYIEDLGVTAIWLNPVLENDMTGGSYHGYATTDYYRVDPRFGTNEEYAELIADAHQRGMKVVMDMIFNHCGSDHPWMKDIPSQDWFNHLDHYVQTNHDKEVYFDPYASDYDRDRMLNGWFVPTMPDLNQRNPHVAKYLIQNSIWWIEYSGVDGIRQDTYPYADKAMMRAWCEAVEREYPHYNIVGEAWMNYTIGSAYWQRGSRLDFEGDDSGLRTVMDFRLMGIASKAFHEEKSGLMTIFEHMCYDFVYPDISHVLRFLENHDTNRFLPAMPQTSEELYAFKQGLAFLLTIPGIPQLYYGQELLMNGTKAKSDGYVRLDVPGGWPGDSKDEFTAEGRNAVQNEAWDFLRTLLHWRKGNDVIAQGSMKHFMPDNGVYVYERRLGDRNVIIILNGNNEPTRLPLARYAEILQGKSTRTDILTGHAVSLGGDALELASKAVLILD